MARPPRAPTGGSRVGFDAAGRWLRAARCARRATTRRRRADSGAAMSNRRMRAPRWTVWCVRGAGPAGALRFRRTPGPAPADRRARAPAAARHRSGSTRGRSGTLARVRSRVRATTGAALPVAPAGRPEGGPWRHRRRLAAVWMAARGALLPGAAPGGRKRTFPMPANVGIGAPRVCGEFSTAPGGRLCEPCAAQRSCASIRPLRIANRTSAGRSATPSLVISRLR